MKPSVPEPAVPDRAAPQSAAPQSAAPQPPGTGSAGTLIGLDIGGSKTHGIMISDGTVVAEARSGSANTQNLTEQSAREALAELFAALEPAALDPAGVRRVIAGAGGVDTEADAAALRTLIASFAPNAHIDVIHDTRLLLAAGHARTGVAVIAGTGSAVWGMNADGDQARAGGWGYLLGDEGSGYWVARESVRYALTEFNRGHASDPMVDALLAECGLATPDELIRHFHSGTGRRYWAGRAHIVFDAAAWGHGPSVRIIDRAGAALAALAVQVAGQLGITGPVVLGSGLGMHQPLLQDSFREHLAGAGLTEVRVLDQEPVYGILELADAGELS